MVQSLGSKFISLYTQAEQRAEELTLMSVGHTHQTTRSSYEHIIDKHSGRFGIRGSKDLDAWPGR